MAVESALLFLIYVDLYLLPEQGAVQRIKPQDLLISTLVNIKEKCITTVFQVGAAKQLYSLCYVHLMQLVLAQKTLKLIYFTKCLYCLLVVKEHLLSLVFGLTAEIEKGFFMSWINQKKLILSTTHSIYPYHVKSPLKCGHLPEIPSLFPQHILLFLTLQLSPPRSCSSISYSLGSKQPRN